MAEPENKPAAAARNRKSYRFGNRAGQAGAKLTFKSKVTKLEEDTFNVGASSDPARFRKSLKAIKTYIQKTYKMPDDIVKSIQQMKRSTLLFPAKPMKARCVNENNVSTKTNMKWQSSPGKRNTKPPFTKKRSTKKKSEMRGL
jgi:hypothetical protein